MRTIRAAAWLVPITLVVILTPARTLTARMDAQAGTAQADAGIREVLRQYATALEHLDADAVKKVQPSIEVENLKKAFREMRALNVTIEDVRVLAADGAMARVSCKVNQTLTPKAGSKQTTAVTRVMRLRRQVGSWIIDGFER